MGAAGIASAEIQPGHPVGNPGQLPDRPGIALRHQQHQQQPHRQHAETGQQQKPVGQRHTVLNRRHRCTQINMPAVVQRADEQNCLLARRAAPHDAVLIRDRQLIGTGRIADIAQNAEPVAAQRAVQQPSVTPQHGGDGAVILHIQQLAVQCLGVVAGRIDGLKGLLYLFLLLPDIISLEGEGIEQQHDHQHHRNAAGGPAEQLPDHRMDAAARRPGLAAHGCVSGRGSNL